MAKDSTSNGVCENHTSNEQDSKTEMNGHIPENFDNADEKSNKKLSASGWSHFGAIILVAITATIWPQPNSSLDFRVFFYAWMTAVSTAFGAFPFFFVQKVSDRWQGISNAVAAGMMLSASICLAQEGKEANESTDDGPSWLRCFYGILIGVVFILIAKYYLHDYDELQFLHVKGIRARRLFLLVLVMFLHSFSEGVGIGVSFGQSHDAHLGLYISAALAIHNIPEGLTVALSLVAQNFSAEDAALCAFFTSFPQPLMALPAFWFVRHFQAILPYGLGFAAGATAAVALLEVLPQAYEQLHSFFSVFFVFFFKFCFTHFERNFRRRRRRTRALYRLR